MARFTNADGPDTIIGTNETDFVWQDTSGSEYYQLGVNDNDVIDTAGGNTDFITLTPGQDVLADSEGWFGLLEQPFALTMRSVTQAEFDEGVRGTSWSNVQPRALDLDFRSGTYRVEWWGRDAGAAPEFVVASSGTISGIRRVEGTESGDTLAGTDFEVGFSDGSLRGEAFHLGGGADRVNGRGGFDVVLPGPVGFDDRTTNFVVNLDKGTVQNLDGSISTIRNIEGAELGFGTDDVFIGDAGDNWVTPHSGFNNVTGGPGTDTVNYNFGGFPDPAPITVRLNAGEIDNQYGTIDRLEGFEIVRASPYDDTMLGDGEGNVFYGNNGDDDLLGLGGPDTLIGGFGEDEVQGNGGDDHLTGLVDADELRGDAGFDYADYSREFGSSAVTVDLGAGTATDTYSATDRLFAIEGAIGTDGRDEMKGDGGANHFLGGGDRDTLRGKGRQDTLDGQGGGDELFGQGGKDALNGDAGNDTLQGQGGADELNGADGKDRLEGGARGDGLDGGGKADTLLGNAGADTLDGGAGADEHRGGGGSDRIEANRGNDVYDGGGGVDAIGLDAATAGVRIDMGRENMAGGGLGRNAIGEVELVFGTEFGDFFRGDGANNGLYGFDGKDKLYGEAGNDRLFGGVGSDVLDGGKGRDLLDGDRELPGQTGRVGKGNDVLRGGGGDDDLDGGRGKDRLIGGNGDDRMNGSAGDDTLTGGDGTDTFVFGPGRDTATDFDVDEDVLDVTGRDGGLAFSDLAALKDAASGSRGVNGTTRIEKDGAVLTLQGVGVDFLDEIAIDFA